MDLIMRNVMENVKQVSSLKNTVLVLWSTAKVDVLTGMTSETQDRYYNLQASIPICHDKPSMVLNVKISRYVTLGHAKVHVIKILSMLDDGRTNLETSIRLMYNAKNLLYSNLIQLCISWPHHDNSVLSTLVCFGIHVSQNLRSISKEYFWT